MDGLLLFLTARKYRFHRHACAMLLPLVLIVSGKRWGEFSGAYDYLEITSSYLILTGVFYINIYILIPKLFYKGKSLKYLAALAGVIAIGLLILYVLAEYSWENYRLLPRKDAKASIYGLLGIAIFLTPFYLISTAFKLLQRWAEDTQRIHDLEKWALQSELKALRTQIQPHFLFNMLNNIMVVNKSDPELASGIILKLSDFLRYLLYESNENEVYLSQEISFIQDFLELERLRRDDFVFEIEYDSLKVMTTRVPCHILLTLAENAVKHSVDPGNESFVKIRIKIKDNRVAISCENSVPDQQFQPYIGGLGLANMKRRLELLFADHFEYIARRENLRYIVDLSIPL